MIHDDGKGITPQWDSGLAVADFLRRIPVSIKSINPAL